MNASWILDYDHITDKNYYRPGCPDCNAPVGMNEDGKYHCYSCGKTYEVTDPKMMDWLSVRSETKKEIGNCFHCNGKNCVHSMLVRNPVTLEWQNAWGECSECGMRYIV